MKKLVSSLLIFIIIVATPLRALADCDFKTGITKTDQGYLYTPDCHKQVGKMVQDLKDRAAEVDALNKTISLKDLTITTDEKRAQLWMDTSIKLEDRVNTIESMKATNQWLYFGLGILATGAAVWGAGQLRR